MAKEHSTLTGSSLHEPKGVAAASANRVYVSDGAGSGSWTTVGNSVLATEAKAFQAGLLHITYEVASGTDGGSFLSGAYRTRPLNTVKTNEISGASLASNQITLPAGTYFITAELVTQAVGRQKHKLRNITDSTDTIIGLNGDDTDAGSVMGSTTLSGRFTIGGSKVFELQGRCTSGDGGAGNGMGGDASYGDVEVYANVLIWKTA
jgi:hypothetical protein